ncbi:CHAP domain-containing protein [Kitasatospora sp. NPDC002227]|uniref:CHAP domain-containing protein n=1 Tax=Kitasatospora sp. NPDC002227 TaxID=3154773 RepID=UPI00331AA8B5
MPRKPIARTLAMTAALAVAGSGLISVAAAPANAAASRSQIVSAAVGQLGHGCSSAYDGMDCSLNWCAAFATWAWGQGGVDVSRLGWTVTTFVNYGDNNGTWHDPGTYTPQPGDAMIFGGSGFPTKASGGAHVGIVEKVNSNGTITEIGGNQGNSVTEVTGTADSIEHNLEGSSYNFLGYVSPAGLATTTPPPASTSAVAAGTKGSVVYPNGLAATFKIQGGSLYDAWQTLPTRTFTSANLGDGGAGGLVGTPNVILDTSGRTSVFARTSGGAIATVWQPAAGAAMDQWATNLAAGSPTFASDPTTVRYNNGAFGVFAIDTSGSLWTSWQPGAGSGWVGWVNLGNGGTGGLTGNPTAIMNTNGLPSVFARTTSGAIATVWQPAAGAAMDQWATNLAAGSPTFASDPTTVRYNNGAFGVFAIDTSGSLWTSWQPGAGSGWVGWVNLGNGGTGGLTGNPTAVTNANGLPSVFARTTSGAIATVWQPAAGAAMDQWATNLAAGAPAFTRDPSAVLYPNGAFAAFAVDGTGAEWASWQNSAGAGFTNWAQVQ